MNKDFTYWQKLAYVLFGLGIVLSFIPAASIVAGAPFGLGLALCMLMLQAVRRAEKLLVDSKRNLAVASRRIKQDRSVTGREVEEEVVLCWRGAMPVDLCLLETHPLPGFEYKSDVKYCLFLSPGAEKTVINKLCCHTIGKMSLGEITVRISEDWGLFEIERALDAPCQQIFYPPAYRKFQLSPQAAMGLSPFSGIHHLSRPGDGSELHEIRNYHTGDSYRKMLWGATARTGRLIVREFASEVNIPVVFVLNSSWFLRFGSPRMMFDQLVETALVLAEATYEAGDPFGYCLYGDNEIPGSSGCQLPVHSRQRITELMKSLLSIRVHQPPAGILDISGLNREIARLLNGRAETFNNYCDSSSVRKGLKAQGFIHDESQLSGQNYANVLMEIADRNGLPAPILHSRFKEDNSVEYSLECEEIARLNKMLLRLIPLIKDKALFVVSVRPYESGKSMEQLCRVLSQIPRRSHRLLVLYPDYPSYTKRGSNLPRNIDFCLKALRDNCLPVADVVTAMDFYNRRDLLRRHVLSLGGGFENIDASKNINFIVDMINHQRYSQGGQCYARPGWNFS